MRRRRGRAGLALGLVMVIAAGAYLITFDVGTASALIFGSVLVLGVVLVGGALWDLRSATHRLAE